MEGRIMCSWIKRVCIVFISVLGIVLITFIYKSQKKKWEAERQYYLIEQQSIKKELEPLMEEARSVMRGEKQERENLLKIYNFHQDGYKDVVSIDADAEIVVADMQDGKGTLVVTYFIHQLNKDGEIVSWDECGGESVGTIWEIERQEDGRWEVIDIPYPEGGEDSMKEVEKLVKKLKEYQNQKI